MVAMTRWHLIRHGALAAPWRGQIVGVTDADAELPDPRRSPFGAEARWLVTPRARTQQTARYLGATSWQVVPELAEQDFGAWEGGRWHDLIAQEPQAMAYLEAYDRVRPPGGESASDLSERVLRAFARLNQEHEGSELVAVLHAGPIRCLLAHALGFPVGQSLKLSIDHLSWTTLSGLPGAWQVERVNHALPEERP